MSANKNSAPTGYDTRLSARQVYDAIRSDGDQELTRPILSLWWSGVAAGIAISTSLVATALLELELPGNEWGTLLAKFGYCAGFVIVILGRMQLFTENTITAVLPVMADTSRRNLFCVARLWAVVLLANLVGTFLAALFADTIGYVSGEQLEAFYKAASKLLEKSWYELLATGIPAGFLIASIVWMMPNSRGFEIWVIVLPTFLIALGDFTHVIVGSVEAFLLVVDGRISLLHALGGCLLPVLIGNVIGGTALFSLLAYGQVREEIK